MTITHQLYLDTLRRTQFLPADRLLRYQRGLLEQLLRHAQAQTAFYSERLRPVIGNGRMAWERWHEIPLTTRANLGTQAAQFHARNVPAEAGVFSEGTTSGTAGTALMFRTSSLANVVSNCQRDRMLEAHDIDLTAHCAGIRNDTAVYPLGIETSNWNDTFPRARFSRLQVSNPIADQAEWLARRKPRYLNTYPSNAAGLAEYVAASGVPVKLEAVMTVGELVSDDMREAVKSALGARIIDTYGATEAGYLAFECPAGGGYHIAQESVLLEVIDEQGQPVPPGGFGRVVVTSLYNYAMPFIRYLLEDYAETAEGTCGCGRTLPRLKRILGRSRNLFRFNDGTLKSPHGMATAFAKVMGAERFQIIQTTRDTIEIRYVARPGAPEPDPDRIQQTGRAAIHPSVSTRAVAVDHIARHPSGKIEDVYSLVRPNEQT